MDALGAATVMNAMPRSGNVMRVLKVLLWIAAFLVVGAIGFFVGGAGGAAVGALGGSIGGTLMGACTAAQVGAEKGILTPEQQTALIDATAESLRATYADLLAQLQPAGGGAPDRRQLPAPDRALQAAAAGPLSRSSSVLAHN